MDHKIEIPEALVRKWETLNTLTKNPKTEVNVQLQPNDMTLLESLIRGENVNVLTRAFPKDKSETEWIVRQADINLAKKSDVEFIRSEICKRLRKVQKSLKSTVEGFQDLETKKDRDNTPACDESLPFSEIHGSFMCRYDTYFRRLKISHDFKQTKDLCKIIDLDRDNLILIQLLVSEMDKSLTTEVYTRIAAYSLQQNSIFGLIWAVLWPGSNLDDLGPAYRKVKGKSLDRDAICSHVAETIIPQPAEREMVQKLKFIQRYYKALNCAHGDLKLSDRELVRAYGRVRNPFSWDDKSWALRSILLHRLIQEYPEDGIKLYSYVISQPDQRKLQPHTACMVTFLSLEISKEKLRKTEYLSPYWAQKKARDDFQKVQTDLKDAIKYLQDEGILKNLSHEIKSICCEAPDLISEDVYMWSSLDSGVTLLEGLSAIWGSPQAKVLQEPVLKLKSLLKKF
ncbi:hypothetical protein FE257_002192 [Aspergillus nanangensis]|uniref:Uncharacterized protein n=1 Tax=Aspergillus nanangensis TaxID=2582783 RepID=A0AAD4GP89_ASPNN|nr:hypothetical protein FE257_002192 [Aspergillus nanangensis]